VVQILSDDRAKASWLDWGRVLIGTFLSLASVGCPGCGAPLLSALGFEDGLSAFPMQGLEIKLLAAVLFGSLVWEAGRKKSRMDAAVGPEPEAEEEPHADLEPTLPQMPSRRTAALKPALLMLGAGLAFLLLPKLPAEAKLDFRNTDRPSSAPQTRVEPAAAESSELISQIFPPNGYAVPALFGDLGPRLLEAGAIDLDRFTQVYENAGQPLTQTQLEILTQVSEQPIVIDQDNAYFLLNLFWAFGLTNANPILLEGPMVQYAQGDISSFASTGGWTLGDLPGSELYASVSIVELTAEQQALVEKVAAAVYRPCCDNPTHFPDCNHGMAMLGLFEWMAAQGATESDLFEAAKYFNAYWFPQQTLEIAKIFQVAEELAFSNAPAYRVVGPQFASGSGFSQVHAWLVDNGQLEQAPRQGGSCGV
ncbi:MAG TPA: hypothetical protein VF982_12055, partial [Anaerolineales bacterium]